MALLTICLACSTFMIVLLFRELRAPFTKQRGGKFPKQRTEAKRLVRTGWNGSHAGVTQAFRGAKRASGDRRRAAYSPGRGNLKAAKRGELAQSSPGRKTLGGGSGVGSGGDSSKVWNASRNMAA